MSRDGKKYLAAATILLGVISLVCCIVLDDVPARDLAHRYAPMAEAFAEGNWQFALNNYLEAIDRSPESPAVEAKRMVMDILEFYNKDMFNQ